jgi:hypothetical protein
MSLPSTSYSERFRMHRLSAKGYVCFRHCCNYLHVYLVKDMYVLDCCNYLHVYLVKNIYVLDCCTVQSPANNSSTKSYASPGT